MDNRFSPEEWSKLSVNGRLDLCVSMAKELRERAEPALAARDDYLRLADQWDALASDMANAAVSSSPREDGRPMPHGHVRTDRERDQAVRAILVGA